MLGLFSHTYYVRIISVLTIIGLCVAGFSITPAAQASMWTITTTEYDAPYEDPNSAVSKVNDEAIKAGKLVVVRNGATNVDGSDVDGAATSITTNKDGEEVAVVTIDPTEEVVVNGINTSSRTSATRTLSDEKNLEHEIAGHGREFVKKGRRYALNSGREKRAVRAGNLYRSKNRIPFRRIGHAGRVRKKK